MRNKIGKSKEAPKLVIERIPIAELKPHPRNYKVHPEDELDHIAESLKNHGFYKNIIIAKDNTILAGHGVIEAAKRLGMTEAPCCRVALSPDDPRAIKILIGDNEIGHMAEINDRLLTDMLQELNVSGLLLGTGYDDMMLAGRLYVTRNEGEVPNLDAAKEWVGMPEYKESDDDIKLVVNFRNEKDRATFIKKTKLEVSGQNRQTKTAWYPPKARNDIKSLKFKEA